jgi:DNA-binding GntR family transcriptional regulator
VPWLWRANTQRVWLFAQGQKGSATLWMHGICERHDRRIAGSIQTRHGEASRTQRAHRDHLHIVPAGAGATGDAGAAVKAIEVHYDLLIERIACAVRW